MSFLHSTLVTSIAVTHNPPESDPNELNSRSFGSSTGASSSPSDSVEDDDSILSPPTWSDDADDATTEEEGIEATTDCATAVISPGSSSLMLSVTDVAMTEMIQICQKYPTPKGFIDEFMICLKRHVRNGFDPLKAPSLDCQMSRLRSLFPSCHVDEIIHPSSGIMVPKFSLLEQLKDLFSSPYFHSTQYCCVNEDRTSRFLKYKPPVDEGVSDLLCSRWYKETYDQRIGLTPTFVDPVSGLEYHNWVTAVTMYNDKTGVSAMEGSYTLEPLMFTLGVIKRTYRENADAWRHLGFLPTLKSGSKMAKFRSPEESLALQHELLSILLADLVELQLNPPLLTLNLFGQEVNVRLILDVAFIIGDQLSQDTHCARKKINGGGAGRIHRSCMTSFLHASTTKEGGCTPVSKPVLDNLCEHIWLWEEEDRRQTYVDSALLLVPEHNGRRRRNSIRDKQKQKIELLLKTRSQVAREILEKTFSTYPVHNAWSRISFGSNTDGIYRATLDDPMHYNSSGLFQYLMEIAFKGLLPQEALSVEKTMRREFSQRSSVRTNFPRGKFTESFSNCTLISASQRVGLIFSLYLSLGNSSPDRVGEIFHESIFRQQKKYIDLSFLNNEDDASGSVNGAYSPQDETSGFLNVSSLPKVADRYFNRKQTDCADSAGGVMPRTIEGVRNMVDDMNCLGLLKTVEPLCGIFDTLQIEYFLSAIWVRVTKKGGFSSMSMPPYNDGSNESCLDDETLELISQDLQSRLKPGMETSVSQHTSVLVPHKISSIQSKIEKHGLDKPKISGRADTSAILTDVKGFRKVLEYTLLFHAIVHEFHQMDDAILLDLHRLKVKIDSLMTSILSMIYRGDDSFDVGTCKCHAHFHLANAIEYYGAPMGFDASKGERNLKPWAKHISKTARKCGEQMFIGQTARRVSDHQLLQRAKSYIESESVGNPSPVSRVDENADDKKWNYTRKNKCHMSYDLRTGNAGCDKLLTSEVVKALRKEHGRVGIISIWKEIKVNVADDHGTTRKGYHYVRAFHNFDEHGPFFDWVHLVGLTGLDNNNDCYRPGKVLLLYQFEEKDFALVWKAQTPSRSDRDRETNISARWKMVLTNEGLPEISCVPLNNIEKSIYVYEHWWCVDENHLPSSRLPPGGDTSMFVIDEVYDRYAWALNALDPERWKR
jgi:hypothetical protein